MGEVWRSSSEHHISEKLGAAPMPYVVGVASAVTYLRLGFCEGNLPHSSDVLVEDA